MSTVATKDKREGGAWTSGAVSSGSSARSAMTRLTAIALPLLLAAAARSGEPPKPPVPADAPAADHANQGRHIRIPADQVVWGPAPASVPPGAQLAVLEGDPKLPGISTFRLKLPAGYKVPPHWHPADERVTVLSGTFALGMGETWDEATVQDLPAGSFTVMPRKHGHFAVARTEAVIQLTIVGPWGINYFNPADDPRNSPRLAK